MSATDTSLLIADTLKMMEIHENLEEFGGCLFWTGATTARLHPKIANGHVRRVLWALMHGPIPERMLVTTKCGHVKCLSCLALVTRSEVSRKALADPVTKLKRRASCARLNRISMGKITIEIAREIRASPKTGREMARELGVSESLVSLVRLGKSWVEFTGNPFSGLMR